MCVYLITLYLYISNIYMIPLSNDKLISLFNNLTSKVNKLTEIVNFQTNYIQDYNVIMNG